MKTYDRIVDGNNFIRYHLKNNIPFAAGKLGSNELQILHFALRQNNRWSEQFKKECEEGAGLFPMNEDNIMWFKDTLLTNLHHLDLAPLWSNIAPDFERQIFNIYAKNAYMTKLQHLEPYFFDNPWTDFLEDKTVAVFSPFSDSIEQNFKNLSNIWNGKIKNNFKLITVKYPTSIPITANSPYNNSREVYTKYIDIINNTDFDVGIFGTGHTGLLFALECKQLNKTGIHLGGPTQILFGIKGSRWEPMSEFKTFFNEYWTTPLKHETPEKFYNIENGCYW
jgi:hypothetical protein